MQLLPCPPPWLHSRSFPKLAMGSRAASTARAVVAILKGRGGDPEAARALLERVLQEQNEAAQDPWHHDTVLLYNLLSEACCTLRDFVNAKKAAETAVDLSEKVWGSCGQEVAAALIRLAAAHCGLAVGDRRLGPTSLDTATKSAERAVAIERLNPRCHKTLRMASALCMLGMVQAARFTILGEVAMSAATGAAITEASIITESVLGGEHPGLQKALALRDMASLYAAAPGSEEEAGQLYKRCGELLGVVHAAYPAALDSLWEATSGSIMADMVYPDGSAAQRRYRCGVRAAHAQALPGGIDSVDTHQALLACPLSDHLQACETPQMDDRKIAYLEHKFGLV